jgi:hypothetical protein
MRTIQITYQEVKMATRPNVYRNKKKYDRKDKSWKKSYLTTLVFILMSTFMFSQTNTNYLIENEVTKETQTKSVIDFNKQYTYYLEKSYNQRTTATWVGVVGGLVSSIGYTYYFDDPRMRQGILFTSILTSCLSTTFYISSSNNRRKAYQLKSNKYLK